MKPELITLILNVMLIAFLAFGFLFGLRGIKKATRNLCTFLVTIVVVLILGPLVSKLILNISISGTTINGHIIRAVNDMIGEELASTEAVQDIIKNIPLLVVNIVVAIVLIFVLGFILRIIGAIIYRVVFGKEKVKEIEECKIINGSPQMVKRTVKPKKHRLLGGLVGFVHGALLLFVIIFPLLGLVNIFSDIAGINSASAYAETTSTSGFKIQSSKDLINENVPDEAFDYVKAVNNSVLYKIGRVGGLSELSLNIVSRCEINGEIIRLGDEIRTLVGAYDSFVDFVLTSSSDLTDYSLDVVLMDVANNPNNYNFDKLYDSVDKLFESKIVSALGNDALKIVAQKMEEANTNTNAHDLFLHIKTAVNSYADNNYKLKDDAKSIIGVFEVTAKSGLLSELRQSEFNFTNVKNILINEPDEATNTPKNKVLGELTTKLTSSNLLQKFVLEFTNYGLEKFEDIINQELLTNPANPIRLSHIDSLTNVKVSDEELNNLIVNAIDIYDKIETIDINELQNDFYIVFDSDIENLVKLTGKEIDVAKNLAILKDTGVLDSVCQAMNKTKYSKYLDFIALKNSTTITNQFNLLANSVKELTSSGVINTLRTMDDLNKDASIDEIIDKLATKKEGKTYANRIISPVLNCEIFKNLFEYGIDEANGVVLDGMKLLDETAQIDKFNTTALMTERENQEILSIVDNLIMYLKDVSFADLKDADTMKDAIINSNLTLLGNALDAIANATLFSATQTGNGVYNDMISVLKQSSFSDVFNFNAIQEDGFVWNTQLHSVSDLIDSLNSIQIDGENFVKYLMNGGDYSVILDNITSADVQKIKPLFEISIIRPIGVKVVNEINNKFKDFVGATLGANITEYAKTTNLSAQAQQITNIIASALDLDFNNTDIDTINSDTINNILDKLSANANSNGVFKEAYNAFLLKTVEMINVSVKNIVGNSVGKNIVTSVALQDILSEEQTIRTLLNNVIGLSNDFATIDLNELDSDKLNSFVNSFNVSTPKTKAIIGETHNALLVYTVNSINKTILDSVGLVNFPDYTVYDGDTNMTSKKGTIADILECACEVYGSLAEGEGLEELDNTEILENLYDALESTSFTSSAKEAIQRYIQNTLLLP